MKVAEKTQSASKPNKFSVIQLLNDKCELIYCADIEEEEIVDSMGDEETISVNYSFDKYFDTIEVSGYDDLISALVSLIYTSGDEISLMRKGIADESNEEYVAYLEYVAECKQFAREYYGIN